MIAKNPVPRRVAIIRNYKLNGPWGQEMLDSFTDLIHAADRDALVEHFQPIDGGELPDSSKFDLVILTGGTYDLTQPNIEVWVAQLLDWVRDVVANHPDTKLLGICWGHQAISHALGGKIAYRQGGTLVDVVDIPLTETGRKFFTDLNSLRLHKFHKRIVAEPPPGFKHLAENHEIFISESDQVMTFQGHPEMTAKIAQGIISGRDASYFPDPTPEGIAQLNHNLEKDEDGKKAFSRVMSWAFDVTS
ncbi:uncharacterized protein PV06_01715 [Exophiala oligosperma]|uniref:Glutamine amidotransferase domain-containing protein n=1 Tax=Exophiala oligosperma TaxID=215243 RepID=A0A0D2C8D2_9EURO|nr:uncharacterized protein PV06_01715 [Exophiala oligosperma]KIW46022.1 hypothetical protein PV06_01715 [Exophiala oligosperma]